MIDLTVIIPAYNEERNIYYTLKEIQKHLKGKVNYEAIVVNDGSTDETSSIARTTKIKELKIVDFKKNKGKGLAVKKGALVAKGKMMLYMDADNSTSIKHFFNFFPYIKKYDIVIGSRSLSKSRIIEKQPFFRRLLGSVGGFLIKKTLKLNYSDTQCGFKLFKREAMQHIFPKTICNGWAFDFEILKIAEKKGLRVIELPVAWKNNKESKVKILDFLITLRDLFFV